MHVPPSCSLLLNETLPIPTVGRDLVYDSAIGDKQQVRKPLTKLARFAMTHKYRVADLEWYGSFIFDRCLHLTRSFERDELRSLRQGRLWLPFRAGPACGQIAPHPARGNIAAEGPPGLHNPSPGRG